MQQRSSAIATHGAHGLPAKNGEDCFVCNFFGQPHLYTCIGKPDQTYRCENLPTMVL